MPQYSTLPDTQIPKPPTRESTRRLLLRGYFTWCLLIVFAWPAFIDAFGNGAFVGITIATGAVFLVLASSLITQQRPRRFPWRRLPWAALTFVVFGVLSTFWSQWRETTLITSMVTLAISLGAVVIAWALTWRELIGCLAAAFKWIVGLSLVFELWAAVVLRHPIASRASHDVGEAPVWVNADFFHLGTPIQGVVGSPQALGMLCSFALVVFVALALEATGRHRLMLWAWAAMSGVLLLHSWSSTAFVATLVGALVVASALVMRTASTSTGRRNRYIALFASAGVLAAAASATRFNPYAFFGHDHAIADRADAWQHAMELGANHPVIGNGFASPWLGLHPEWSQAHNAWIDVYLQLGWIGLLLIALATAALVWRSWFFAVDRPRIDLNDHRKYSPLTLVPLAITFQLIAMSITESLPIHASGWALAVMLAFKMKISPVLCAASQPCYESDRAR